MTPEELTKKQIDGYHNLLGYLGMCIISKSHVTVTDIKNRFKELYDKGLLPESLKYLTDEKD